MNILMIGITILAIAGILLITLKLLNILFHAKKSKEFADRCQGKK